MPTPIQPPHDSAVYLGRFLAECGPTDFSGRKEKAAVRSGCRRMATIDPKSGVSRPSYALQNGQSDSSLTSQSASCPRVRGAVVNRLLDIRMRTAGNTYCRKGFSPPPDRNAPLMGRCSDHATLRIPGMYRLIHYLQRPPQRRPVQLEHRLRLARSWLCRSSQAWPLYPSYSVR